MRQALTKKLSSIIRSAAQVTIIALSFMVFWHFATLMLVRIPYPFLLEWMEGGTVDHVCRVIEGKNLYPPPTLDYLPFIYPPLYNILGASAFILFGETLSSLRLISLMATLGTIILIYDSAKSLTKQHLSGVIAATTYCASYGVTGGFMDLARVDSTALFLQWVIVWAMFKHKSGWQLFLASACLGFALLTKQTAIFTLLGTIAYTIIKALRNFKIKEITLTLAPALAISICGYLASYITNGWWLIEYLFVIPSNHPVRTGDFFSLFLVKDLLSKIPVLIIASVLLVFRLYKSRNPTWLFIVIIGSSFLIASVLPRLKVHGYVNNLMPIYSFLCVLWGASWNLTEISSRISVISKFVFAALFALQISILSFDYAAFRPSKQAEAEGVRLVTILKSLKGPFFSSQEGLYLRLAGHHQTSMHLMPFIDLRLEPIHKILTNKLGAALASCKFNSVLSPLLPERNLNACYKPHMKPLYKPIRGPRIREKIKLWIRNAAPSSINKKELHNTQLELAPLCSHKIKIPE